MPRKSISSLSPRGVALVVLSKFLYAISGNSSYANEIKVIHQKLLNKCQNESGISTNEDYRDTFSVKEIPWDNLLDLISQNHPFIKAYVQSGNFTTQEIRYMCAMMCGLSGKEYEKITGKRSHYNISWSIRHKLGIPFKETNLRLFIRILAESAADESLSVDAPN